MGFNRSEIRIKATNISVVGCRVVSGAITATVSAHSHLHGRVTDVPG